MAFGISDNRTDSGASSGYASIVITILNTSESRDIYISKYTAKESTFLICLYGSVVDTILNHCIVIGIAHNTADTVYACIHRNAAAKYAVFHDCASYYITNNTANMCHCSAGFCNDQIGCNV